MSSKLMKAGAIACALTASVCMFGCSGTNTASTEGPAATSIAVTARTESQMEVTAAYLDKQSDNDTIGQTGAKAVKLGQTVTTDRYSFTLNSYEYTDVIKPGASGDTALHLDQPGEKYLVVKGTFTNTSSTPENIRKGTASWFTYGNIYPNTLAEFGVQGWTDAIVSDGTAFSNYIVQPGETVDVIVYASTEDRVAENATTAQFIWGFNNDLNDRYYEADHEGESYLVTVY